jgi:hypothetical protein
VLDLTRRKHANHSVHSRPASVFDSDERREPPHIHARKGHMDCKFWLLPDWYGVREDYAYNLSPWDNREVRRFIFSIFDYILAEYEKIHEGNN